MATANIKSLDYHVNAYAQNLETKIIREITAINLRLASCKNNNEGAVLKAQAMIRYTFLPRLQCKNMTDTCDQHLREDILKLQTELIAVKDTLTRTTNSLETTHRIILELKRQLQARNLEQVRTAEVNEDLRRQLERAHKQVNTDTPDDKECVLSTAEPDAPAAESVESLCGDTTPSEEVDHPQEEDLHVPEPRVRRRRNWFLGAFKGNRADKNVGSIKTEAPDDKECVPSAAEPFVGAFKGNHADKNVSSIKTEALDDKECVPSTAEPDTPAAESVENLCGDTTPSDEVQHPQHEDLQVPELSVRRRRRNWFVGAFKGNHADKNVSSIKTEALDDKECVPSTAEPDTPAAESVENLCGDTTPSDEVQHPQHEDLQVPELSVRRRRRNWFVGAFKGKHADKNVPDDKECVPSNTEPDAPAAVSAVSVESLSGDTTALSEPEHPQERDLYIPEPSIRRRRNWFVRMFACGRAEE